MNQLIWRLHRNQAYFAAGALGALIALLLVTGIAMAHDYHAFLATCRATGTCGNANRLFSGDGSIIDLVDLTVVVPLLFGLFWGAPLVAKEYEDGTQNLAWTQGVARRRWMSVNVMWALLAAMIWGGAMAALVSWWRAPENAIGARLADFDIQGTAPVAYAVFAVALGIAMGSVFKRVLPALATTLGVFVAVRLAVALFLRKHYMTPLVASNPPAGSWQLTQGLVSPSGTYLGQSFDPTDLPAACSSMPPGKGGLFECLVSHGYRNVVTYQPGSRFWIFQGIECGIFLVLAAGLLGLAYRLVLSRDA